MKAAGCTDRLPPVARLRRALTTQGFVAIPVPDYLIPVVQPIYVN
jgi:hypothetical protein